MFRQPPRALAVMAVSLTTTLLATRAIAQTMRVPALPRQDTVRTEDDELTKDSRVGGALSRRTPPSDGLAPWDDSDPRTRGAEIIGGEIVKVSGNNLILTIRPDPDPDPDAAPETLSVHVGAMTRVTKDGEEVELSSLIPGDDVRLVTALGPSKAVLQILAYSDPHGSLNSIHATPPVAADDVVVPPNEAVDPQVAQQARVMSRIRQVRIANTNFREEAVLPLGIEVFDVHGDALVTEMLAGGPADLAGMHVGDLILAIDGQSVANTERIEQLLAKDTGRVELLVQRAGQRLVLTVNPTPLAAGAIVNATGLRRALNRVGIIPVVPVGSGALNVPAVGTSAGTPPRPPVLAQPPANAVELP